MKLLDRLEQKFGRYAVPNLAVFLIACQVLVFAAPILRPEANAGALIGQLALVPAAVFAGEVWRLVTFLFLAPLAQSPIFVLFFWYLLYMMSGALEQSWGVFRFNVYCLIAWLATVGAAFLAYAFDQGPGIVVSAYLYGSIFLAFARLFPEYQFMLFFILPVKVKWLAMLQWLLFGWQFLEAAGAGDWFTMLTIAAAVLNWLLFFGAELLSDVKQGQRRRAFQAKTKRAQQKLTHQCRVCGVTRDQNPKMTFRYCSKCVGSCCYCADHLHNHECVTEEEA